MLGSGFFLLYVIVCVCRSFQPANSSSDGACVPADGDRQPPSTTGRLWVHSKVTGSVPFLYRPSPISLFFFFYPLAPLALSHMRQWVKSATCIISSRHFSGRSVIFCASFSSKNEGKIICAWLPLPETQKALWEMSHSLPFEA